MEIMNTDHELWNEFAARLEGPGGCNFRREDKNDPNSLTWKCAGGMNKDFAIAILKTMPNIDIERSVAFFDEHGGHCDCEILFNVEDEV